MTLGYGSARHHDGYQCAWGRRYLYLRHHPERAKADGDQPRRDLHHRGGDAHLRLRQQRLYEQRERTGTATRRPMSTTAMASRRRSTTPWDRRKPTASPSAMTRPGCICRTRSSRRPALTSTFVYDGSGNPLSRTDPDTTTNTSPTAPTARPRDTQWTWTSTGAELSVQLPRTDVTAKTSFGYDTDGALDQHHGCAQPRDADHRIIRAAGCR